MKNKFRYFLPYTAMTVAILLPTCAVLWLIQHSMDYETKAVVREFNEKAESNAQAAKRHISLWKKELDGFQHKSISQTLKKTGADGVLMFSRGETDSLVYPRLPDIPAESNRIENDLFTKASQLEEETQEYTLASYYYSLEKNHTDINIAGRAIQGQIRSLLKAGDKQKALTAAKGFLKQSKLIGALDKRGYSIAMNIRLIYLDLLKNKEELEREKEAFFTELRQTRFFNAPLEQTVFIKKQLQLRYPETNFPALDAEVLSLKTSEMAKSFELGLQKSDALWVYRNQNGHIFLYGAKSFEELQKKFWSGLPRSLEAVLVSSRKELSPEWITTGLFDDWLVALRYRSPQSIKSELSRRLKIYYFSGAGIVIIALVLLTIVMISYRRNQVLSELKNEVLTNVAHELKTPLASTRLLLETLNLRGDQLSKERIDHYHKTMSRENERLSLLVENFLTFSSLERNTFKINFEAINVNHFADEVKEAINDRFNERCERLSIINKSQVESCFIADRMALLTVIMNLVENAFKYSKKEVKFIITKVSRGIHFDVVDQGVGLDTVQQKKIFKRFYQIDRSLSSGTYGCGLGLSIVQAVIKAHDAEIKVKSEKGKGSSFSFILREASTNS